MLKYAFAAAAVAGAAYAADDCSVSATKTLSSAADATGLSGCSTFSGSLAVATGVTGQLEIPGVKTITGNLVAHEVSRMSQLSASNLEIIRGNFDLLDDEILDTLNFPQLVEVGSIKWSGLPTLSTLQFTTGGLKKAPKIDIQNTGLSKLDTIFPPVMDTIFIANNGMLQTLDFSLGNISDTLDLLGNGDRLSVSFPNLIWANNLTIRDATNVSLPKLEEVRGSIGFYENDFESIAAPNLTLVGQSFSLVQNNQLTNTSFPLLETTGGAFQIANNTNLDAVSGFPKLKNVNGTFDCNGAFSQVDVPALETVRGVFNLQSSEDVQEICDAFEKKRKDQVGFVRGDFTCVGKLSNPAGEGTLPSNSNSDRDGMASSTTISKAVVAVAAFGSAILAFF